MQNSAVKNILEKCIFTNTFRSRLYNFGEYQNKMTVKPTEYDYNLIKKLSENGLGLIQIHENGMMPCAL